MISKWSYVKKIVIQENMTYEKLFNNSGDDEGEIATNLKFLPLL